LLSHILHANASVDRSHQGATGSVIVPSDHNGKADSKPSPHSQLVYTWHETDGQNVTGSMVVKRAALTARRIPFTDVILFSFSIPFYGATEVASKSDIERQTFPIPINRSGTFKSPYPTEGPGVSVINHQIDIPANALSIAVPGASWLAQEDGGDHRRADGVGYWSLDG
jgi:hypothetical protein